MEMLTRIQLVDEADYTTHSTNALGKSMNLIMGK